jgi:hypothetical protein
MSPEPAIVPLVGRVLAFQPMRSSRRSVPLLLMCLSLGSLAGERAASADEEEASFHAQLHVGRALLGDPETAEITDTAEFLGVGARATYATSDWYAYEIHATWNQLGRSARFEQQDGTSLIRPMRWLRVDTGITARLGAQFIPTLHAAIGVQSRFGGDSIRDYNAWAGQADDAYVTLDLIGTLGAGFDYRFTGPGDHWVVGGLVTLQRALLSTGPRYEAKAVMFHVAYYIQWVPGSDPWKGGR